MSKIESAFFCSLEFNIIKKDQSNLFDVRWSRILNFVEIAKKSVKVLCRSIWWCGVDQRHITAFISLGIVAHAQKTQTHAQAFKVHFPRGSDTQSYDLQSCRWKTLMEEFGEATKVCPEHGAL